MTTRFNAKSVNNYGVPGINSGYRDQSASDATIPSCGLVDVDKAVFNLFDKEIQLSVSDKDKNNKKIPVIFVAGEKWSIFKNGRPVRDKNNTIILPLMTIVRNSVEQTDADITGRGINQQTGELVIKTKLDASDRGYQSLVNRFLIPNQKNVATNSPNSSLYTLRDIGASKDDDHVFVDNGDKQHVYEYVVVPSPQFCTVNYEITVWTQYYQHMNQVIDKLFSSYLPQGQCWKVTTEGGYWFIAKGDNTLTPEVNFDDISLNERIIKYQFNIQVQAYIFASSAPGIPIPIKRYVSSPSISFVVSEESLSDANQDYSLGADDPTLPMNGKKRDDGRTRLYDHNSSIDPHDPALQNIRRGQKPPGYKKIRYRDVVTGRTLEKYVRIDKRRGSSGETTYSSNFSFEDISILFNDE